MAYERTDATNPVICSVFAEESAMAKLMEKETAKIQAVVDNPNATPDDLLAINKNVKDVVSNIAKNNEILREKLKTSLMR